MRTVEVYTYPEANIDTAILYAFPSDDPKPQKGQWHTFNTRIFRGIASFHTFSMSDVGYQKEILVGVAIIEWPSGNIELVHPECIKFITKE